MGASRRASVLAHAWGVVDPRTMALTASAMPLQPTPHAAPPLPGRRGSGALAPAGPGSAAGGQQQAALGGGPGLGGPPPRVKLVLLGDSGVGKSCLVLRYVRGQFDESSKITVGAAFMSHQMTTPDGKSLKFEIW